MSFESCTVKHGAEVLFDPSWGTFDMILGESVVSVFGGAADREAYAKKVVLREFKPRRQKCNLTEENRELALLYGVVRELRETGELDDRGLAQLERISLQLDEKFPEDWLLRLEMLELLDHNYVNTKLFQVLSDKLQVIAHQSKKLKMLIDRGLALNQSFKAKHL
jgi:phenylalanine-4-hydroxylase